VKAWLVVAAVVALSGGGMNSQPLPSNSAAEFKLGAPVTDFAVTDMDGQAFKYSSLMGKPTVVIFFSTRCPMSNAFNYRRNKLYLDFARRVNFIVIDPNANESIDEVRAYARTAEFDFPVYKDIDNTVADLFGAQITTDTFVIDASGMIRYHGYLEDSPNESRVKTQGLRRAIEAVLEGRPVAMPEGKALGCSIRRVKP
jgi:cytochrome oxidase Cu insertion factor (SCO1/SenC/PrrC family)